MNASASPLVKRTPPPADSLAVLAQPNADVADAYAVSLTGPPVTVDALARAFFLAVPGWVVALLRLRDRAVRPLGLKTAPTTGGPPALLAELLQGTAVGLFRVLDRRGDELLFGQDDRHLDFRVALRLEQRGARQRAMVVTTVRYRHFAGRAYFAVIRPAHQLIVPAMLRSTARRLAAADRSTGR
jgi:hypothetical protein